MLDALSWTQVSNTFIDALPELSGAEAKIMLAIFRKTIGWHKASDILSASQLTGLTGIADRNTISAALKRLGARQWIRIHRVANGSKIDVLMRENPTLENPACGESLPVDAGKSSMKRLENPAYIKKGNKRKKIYMSTGGNNPKDVPLEEVSKNLIDYLNKRTGREFEADSAVALRELSGRAGDGRTAAEIAKVIAFKCDQWIGTEWEGYLQPSTLFRKSKFDEYLVAMKYREKEDGEEGLNDGRKKESNIENLAHA